MVARIKYADLEISHDWKLSDLSTLADCDEAAIHVTRELASIESQIEEYTSDGTTPGTAEDEDWLRRSRAALKIKGQIRMLIQHRRSDLVRAEKEAANQSTDRRLLAVLKRDCPDAFAAAVESVRIEDRL